MMLTQRNGINIEAELCKGGLNGKDSRRHAEVSGKAGLGLFCPPACSMRIFASHLYIVLIDTTDVTYPAGNCETSRFRPILDAKVQPVD